MRKLLVALSLAGAASFAGAAAQLFPLSDVRLKDGPFLEAQDTDRQYLMALDADRLLAPFRREAGLPSPKPSYGNWESSGLDGHMGGHYVSALALMWASTGDAQVKQRLDHVITELKRCQDALGSGYIGGIPDGKTAWSEVAQGQLKVDSFSVNGRWVPWYNLHKLFAGLRDAHVHAGSEDAKQMLVRFSDWAMRLTDRLSDEQMQQMLKSEHGGMNEVFADVAQLTGDAKYLKLARRFSHQALLQPLLQQRDALTGLHANTQIPKVIGFERIAELTDADGDKTWHQAARFFWKTVVDKRTVAIGGNSVKEHFHPEGDFQPMLNEVEGPETCNSYNMLKLSSALFRADAAQGGAYADYYERTLYNHILSAQHPRSGGFVYFTPMRPQHYRVYSQVDQGMWCCVGSGIESQARHGEFIYAHEGDALYVNLFIASTLNWRERSVRLTQSTRFPDESRSRITVDDAGTFALKLRYPSWVASGAMKLKLNGRAIKVSGKPGEYVEIRRSWAAGDQVEIELPMRTQLEPMPGMKNYYAVLHGPIVLAAKTDGPVGERLNFRAGDSRMGHIAQGPVCPQESAPVFVSDRQDFERRFRPVKGRPLTFTAPGLIQGRSAERLQLIPFFRLHDSRYMLYWAHTTTAQQSLLRSSMAAAESERLKLDAQTIDQVAPGEQQPESDHGFKGEGVESGINRNSRWRHARQWFSYELSDRERRARTLRLSFSGGDAGRRFDLFVNDLLISEILLAANEQEIYSRDFELPAELVKASNGKLSIKFVAKPGSIAGGLYGLRLLR